MPILESPLNVANWCFFQMALWKLLEFPFMKRKEASYLCDVWHAETHNRLEVRDVCRQYPLEVQSRPTTYRKLLGSGKKAS